MGETCDEGSLADKCCAIEEVTTCMDPYLRIGWDRCVICATNGASCNYRTECCSDCCSDGECQEDFESCNLIETFWITTFWFVIITLLLGVAVYLVFKYVCDEFVMVRVSRRL